MKDPEILEAEEQFAFKKAGGEIGVTLRLISSAFKWIGIGMCFHVGWRIVG